MQRLVDDGEKRLREHVARVSTIKSERNREIANALLRQFETAVELLRGRLEAEQRERNDPHPRYPFSRRLR